jgi:predicted permease
MLAYDFRHAFRSLARRPGLSFAVLLILTLGIGSTTTIFSIASSVLLREIPYKDGNRLVALRISKENDTGIFPASYLDVDSWRRQSRTLELISATSSYHQLNLTGESRAERVWAGLVSTTYFDLLGVRPALGRGFRPEEENIASPVAVAVLSHDLWQRRFGADPAILGHGIQVQGMTFQVVGVLPPGFQDIYSPSVDLYVPVTMARVTDRPGYLDNRGLRWLDVFARLRPGVTLAQARQDMAAVSRQLAATFPESNQGYAANVKPLRTFQFDWESMRVSIFTLLIGAVLVLLVGCTNVTNLLLIRAIERRREVALQLALGIPRLRLVRRFVLEGALLCLGGALLGIGAATFAVSLLNKLSALAYNLPAFFHFSVDLRALVGAALLSALISFAIGVIPARKSLAVNIQEELQAAGKGQTHTAGTAFTRSSLVVSAILLSVVLLVGAGLMIKSLEALIRKDPHFRVDRVLSAQFELPANQYKTDESSYQLYKRAIEAARSLPDVQDAGLWAPGMVGSNTFGKFLVPEGRSLEAPEDQVRVYEHRTSPGIMQGLGFTLLKGRFFTAHDDAGHPQVAILSRSAAAALWPSQDPLGKRFWVGPPQKVWVEVAGVVDDVDQRGRLYPDHDFRVDVYFPLFQMRSRYASILLLMRRDNNQTRRQLGELLQPIAPDIPIWDVKTLQERRHDEEAGTRLNTLLLMFFASSALVLAVIGIYSILVYTVRQQSFEIGIRMALGADRPVILRHFVWKGLALLALGLVIGTVLSFGLAKTMSSILFNVSPYDPLVFLSVPCLIGLFSLPAILRPASTATQADPSSLFRLN